MATSNDSSTDCTAGDDVADVAAPIWALVLSHVGAVLLGAALLLFYRSCRLALRREQKQLLEMTQRSEEVRHSLADMDEVLLARLSDRDIKLLNRDWLLSVHESDPDWRMPKRQELERMRFSAARPAFLTAVRAVQLVEAQNRSICVVSYGWTTCENPDPRGEYLSVICQFLRERGCSCRAHAFAAIHAEAC